MGIISLGELAQKMASSGVSAREIEKEIDSYVTVAVVSYLALVRMPSIGIASAQKRLSAFFIVCEFLDAAVSEGEISQKDALFALVVMRFSNRSFRKAASMFDDRHDRIANLYQTEMSQTARLYSDVRKPKDVLGRALRAA